VASEAAVSLEVLAIMATNIGVNGWPAPPVVTAILNVKLTRDKAWKT
jgi:hypothetical protein